MSQILNVKLEKKKKRKKVDITRRTLGLINLIYILIKIKNNKLELIFKV